jgi:hypothetical protein
MSTETQAELPIISLVLDSLHPTHTRGITDSNIFYKRSINGTLSSHKKTNEPATSALPELSTLDQTECRLCLDDTVSRGSLGTIHHASFECARDTTRSASASSLPSVSLVIKLVVGEDKIELLRHEAIIYQYAKRLQGRVLPRSYGYYEDEKQKAAFLLLEDCGNPYGQSFEALPDGSKSVSRPSRWH